MNELKKFVKSYRFLQILTGIIYIFMAILAIKFTYENITESVQLMGLFSLAKGFFEIMNKDKISKRTHHKQLSAVVLGIVDILIGTILVTNITLSTASLAILFGFWFVSDAIISLFMLDLAKSINTMYYIVLMIVDLIGVLLGMLLIIASVTSVINVPNLISYYFLLFGFMKVIGGIINKKNLHSLN
ncbi:DUF308 domain-containing protein [Lactococcus sp. S64]|uniref:DUF308 domain-containing protein n=1 Tax=Lactococcus sp. S64 TaxID=2767459 RepID=UPI0019067823|nr:DUF308 domain-containing protein [Lactococcus sp. S64]MBK0084422.1 DUF308 domain-containing protein [Lactococcus sp. S64]